MEVAENSGPVNTWKKENSYNVTISKLENGSYNVMLSMYEAAKRHISTEVPIGYFVNMANIYHMVILNMEWKESYDLAIHKYEE